MPWPIGHRTWWGGDEVTITSGPFILHGGEFQHAVTETGRKIIVPSPEQQEKNTREKRQAFRDQQAQFRRLKDLGRVETVLAGRARVETEHDPIAPWVRKVAQVLMDKMGDDPDSREKAEEAYGRLLDEAREQASVWRAEGKDALVRRLSILMKSNL